MSQTDTLIPFLFEKMPVRGALVQLKSAWQRMQVGHRYERPVLEVLGHAAAASTLIAQNLKFDGHITLQISGDGPLSILVMQCSNDYELRGMARADLGGRDLDYPALVQKAHCAITVDGTDVERPYQGIVEVAGASLAASLEQYYERSAQVPTHLALVGEQTVAGGILLQQMPSEGPPAADDWRRLGLLAATLSSADLADGIDGPAGEAVCRGRPAGVRGARRDLPLPLLAAARRGRAAHARRRRGAGRGRCTGSGRRDLRVLRPHPQLRQGRPEAAVRRAGRALVQPRSLNPLAGQSPGAVLDCAFTLYIKIFL